MKTTLLYSILPLLRSGAALPQQPSLNAPFAPRQCQCPTDLYIAPCNGSFCECRNKALMTCWQSIPLGCNASFMNCPAAPITREYPRCGVIGTPPCSSDRYCRHVDGACKAVTGCVGVCVPYGPGVPPPLQGPNPGFSSVLPPPVNGQAPPAAPPIQQPPLQAAPPFPQGPNWGTPGQPQQTQPPPAAPSIPLPPLQAAPPIPQGPNWGIPGQPQQAQPQQAQPQQAQPQQAQPQQAQPQPQPQPQQPQASPAQAPPAQAPPAQAPPAQAPPAEPQTPPQQPQQTQPQPPQPPEQPQPQPLTQPGSGSVGTPPTCPKDYACPNNLVCVADPHDTQAASRGSPTFVCVDGGADKTCAGVKNVQCPDGEICVADPRVECSGQACTGICA